MGENGEASSADCADLDKRLPEQDANKEEDVSSWEEGQVKEDKKTSDAILDELFSCIRESGTVVDVAEVITEVSRSRKERATREKSRSRSRSRDRKHKHKKNKKDKKPKKHRSRSRSNDRKRRHRSRSSSPRFAKTGTLADIRINTKTKNLDDLKNTITVTSTFTQNDDDDDLPVGADYRTVMAEAVASSEPSTSQGPSLADLPTAQKMQPAFPLKKSDGEKKDAIEDKSSPMLKKVISEKGGALLVPRKIQIDASKNNGSAADSFGPAPPPATNESKEDEEEDVEMATLTVKSPPKIAFGQISLKVNGGTEKKEEGNGVNKEDSHEKMEVDENVKTEEKTEEKKNEKVEEKEKDKKAAKKMAVRRRRSSSVEKKEKEKKEKEKERKRSRSRSKDRRDRDRSRDRGRDGRRDAGRSNERNRRDDRSRRRSRSRSAEKRRNDDRDRERQRGRRSRSRENRRSRSKSREKIDKKKLLEIALQNARGVSGPVAEKQGVNMKILEKAGGRNIGDIVSYCQKLSETENAEKLGGGNSDDDDFSYKSKKEIKMNIPGSKQLPTSTPQERLLDTAPLRAAFPVSSGAIHRDNTKESGSEWKKVDRASIPSVCTSVQKKLVATSSLNKIKAESEGKSVPVAAFPILPPPPAPPNIRGDLIPPPPPPPMFNPSSLVPPPPMPPTIITPSHDRLIHMPDAGYDEDSRSVGRKMEERSKVVNRLIRDPNDTDAMKRLSQIDDALNNFGKNAEFSGKWMGHTRVNLLSGDELQPHDPRFHAWVKKDLFKNTTPMVGGVGMKLMQKMGWNPGEGLGRENQGDTQPLTLDVKSDRRGLYSEGYDNPISKGKSKGAKKSGGMKTVGSVGGAMGGGGGGAGVGGGGQSEEKNAISAFMEYTQAKRWDPPVFEFQSKGGINKMFTCSVKVNGFEFVGPVCLNKKAAKTECARTALEKINFAAPNVQTPIIYDPSSVYSIPEQIVQARVRSAMEAAELSAMPPPSSYIAPLEMAARPPDKYDPAQILAMQEERDRHEKEERAAAVVPKPVPPPLLPPDEKETPAAPAADKRQQASRGRGRGRGRGGGGRGGMERGGYYPDGPYPPPPHVIREGPPHGQYPAFPHHGMDYRAGYGEMGGGQWRNGHNWEEDFTRDPDGAASSSSLVYGECPLQHGPPSYSSFPSGPFSSRSRPPAPTWTPDDEFHHMGGGGPVPTFHPPHPSQFGRPPNRGPPRAHSPAFEPYDHPPRFF